MRGAARLDCFACRADLGHVGAGPTIRVEEGDRVRVTLRNIHYFPHTIHFHGTIHPNAMDGVPDFTQAPVVPGDTFVYEFIAANPGTHFDLGKYRDVPHCGCC